MCNTDKENNFKNRLRNNVNAGPLKPVLCTPKKFNKAHERDPFSFNAFKLSGGVTPDAKGNSKIDPNVFSKLVHLLSKNTNTSIKTMPSAKFWIEFVRLYGSSGMNYIASNSPAYLKKKWAKLFCENTGEHRFFDSNAKEECKYCLEIDQFSCGVKQLELDIERSSRLDEIEEVFDSIKVKKNLATLDVIDEDGLA